MLDYGFWRFLTLREKGGFQCPIWHGLTHSAPLFSQPPFWRRRFPPCCTPPVDFYSSDTFNYAILTVAADAGVTVETWGIPSYQQNRFPQSAVAPTLILRFRIGLPAGQ